MRSNTIKRLEDIEQKIESVCKAHTLERKQAREVLRGLTDAEKVILHDFVIDFVSGKMIFTMWLDNEIGADL
ncbi:MAG: hypothetical protein SNJ66_11200 [Chloroherpetonaceae bacterium]